MGATLGLDDELKTDLSRQLVKRIRFFLEIVLGVLFLFAVVDLRQGPYPIWVVYPFKAIAAAAAIAGLWAVSRPWAERNAALLAMAVVVTTCIFAAGEGIAVAELASPAILCVAVILTAGTLFPWSVWWQGVAVAAAAVVLGAVVDWDKGSLAPVASSAGAAVAVAFAISIGVAHELRRHREQLLLENLERRRAEGELRELNERLEQRVEERTAELRAANVTLRKDAVERQLAAAQLYEAQKRLQDILDNTTAVVYLKDGAGHFLLVNTQFETIFHLNRDALLGKTDFDVFSAAAATSFRDNDLRVLAANEPIQFEEVVPQDGGVHTYVSVKFPMRDSAGRPYGVCGVSTDITERKAMEAEVKKSEATLSALIENTEDAIWSIDREHRLTAINSAARRYYRAVIGDDLRMGDPLERRAPEEAMRSFWQALYDRGLSGERFTVENPQLIEGQMRDFLISVTPIAEDGEVIGATVFCKEITALKQAQERAHQRQEELTHVLRLSTMGEMAAELAHEINQPLGAISNYAQGCRHRIQAGLAGPTDVLHAVEAIAAEALRAGEIIRRLRRLVRKEEPSRQPVRLNDLITDALRVLDPQLRRHGVQVRLELSEALPEVQADAIQIEQVIINLLLNGLEAMLNVPEPRRELYLRSVVTETGVRVSVGDTGAGFDAAEAENLFGAFYTTKSGGLGMGLAISRSIIDSHGGHLDGENNPAGGSTFSFELPTS